MLKHAVRALMLVGTIILSAACSTLEIKDRYVLQGKSPEAYLPIPDGDLTLGFQPATRFYSFGVLGAPILPTVPHREPTEIKLSVALKLNADHEFSFARSVCIKADAADRLCSDEAEVHAIAMRQDDGSAYSDKRRRWNHIDPFFLHRSYYNVISPRQGSENIDRTAIYELYGYQGTPKWDLMVVEVVYRFTCPSRCPQRVAVSGDDLVSIDATQVALGNQDFHRVHLRDYKPTTPVQ
jgi:hypothetical protein